MEVAGVGLGIAGLAGLFNTCMDVLQRVDSYRNFDVESTYLENQFDSDKLRFERWAEEVGITDGKLSGVHHGFLDDADTASVVARILFSIRDIVSTAGSTSFKLQRRLTDSEESSTPLFGVSEGIAVTRKKIAPARSKGTKLEWALTGKRRYGNQVEMFGVLVQKLYDLVPPGKQSEDLNGYMNQKEKLDEILTDVRNALGWRDWLDWLKEQAEYRKRLNDWLGATGAIQPLDELLSGHLADTCDWILDNSAYLDWVSSDFPANTAKLLWIYGPPGFGKTMLCARLIKHLRNELQHPVSYFFLSSQVEAQKEPVAVIRSWISQVIACNSDAFNLALERSRGKEGHLASQKEIWELLQSIARCLQNHIFVVDGLDETSQSDETWRATGSINRATFLAKLKQSIARTTNRVLIVSREANDIELELCSGNEHTLYKWKITKEDVQRDVMLFSKSIVERRLPNKPRELQEELTDDLARGSGGMFLWIKLHQDSLRGSKTGKQLQRAVKDMPRKLGDTYDRNWQDILRLSDLDQLQALAILRWTTFAIRPLTVLELAEALSIPEDDECDDLCVDELPDSVDEEYINNEIIGLCGSFLEIRRTDPEQAPGSRTVHLIHFSVKEYLLSRVSNLRPITSGSASFSDQAGQHNILGITCVRYLNCERPWTRSNLRKDELNRCPFLEYASTSWYLHASPTGGNYKEYTRLVNIFFRPQTSKWDFWRSHFESDQKSPSANTDGPELKPGTRIYYASLFGLVDTLKFLLREERTELDIIGGRYGTALQAACVKGHMPVFELLICSNANTETLCGEFGSALNAAAATGSEVVVHYLINHGTTISLPDSAGRTPVYLASEYGHSHIVELLLDSHGGADLSYLDSWLFASLAAATLKGHNKVVKLLLDRGPDLTDANLYGWILLLLAALKGHLEIIKLLLDKGVDVAVANAGTRALLRPALDKCHDGLMYLLHDIEASVAVADVNGWTPLLSAARYGHFEIVNLLLDKGASVEAADNIGSTPLHVAARYGHFEIVKLLLDKGASVEVAHNDGWTPLLSAAGAGHLEIVKLLLDRGASVEVADNDGWTPLHSAAANGHLELVKLLLDKGASVEVADNDGLTPLHSAAANGHLEVVKVLLDREVNANSYARDRTTVLHSAVRGNHTECANLLIARGASMAARDIYGKKPIDYAGSHEMEYLRSTGLASSDFEPTDQDTQQTFLRQSVRGIAGQLERSGNKERYMTYYLGHCLLLLNDELSASAVLKHILTLTHDSVSPDAINFFCDLCNLRAPTAWYVCKSCVEVDLCGRCMTKHKMGQGLEGCNTHEFLCISNDVEKSKGPVTTSKPSGFAFEELIKDLQRRYAS